MAYTHFTVIERERIQEMRWEKRSIRAIAKMLGRAPSSVSRELRKNISHLHGHYTPRTAHARAVAHRTYRGRKDRLKNPALRAYVIEKLKYGYSPEQVAGRLPIDHPRETISHEAIYQYIYAQVHRNGWGLLRPGREDLRPYLKRRHMRRVRKGMRGTQRIPRFHGVSIDLRPHEVAGRRVPGHWEGDSMISRKSTVGLNTLVERASGIVCITRINDASAQETRRVVARRLSRFPVSQRKSITTDNGPENASWRELEKALPGLATYFAHPYRSWERGTNENTNGLVRWYFPKGTDFAWVSDDEIAAVEYALNNRPRKRFRFRTPVEVFGEGVALRS